MSQTICASLFYGYVEPIHEDEYDVDVETPWDQAHGLPGVPWPEQQQLPYTIEYYGVGSSYIAHYLAIRETLANAEWHKVQRIDISKLTIKPEWEGILKDAARRWDLDVSGLEPGWHLVVLYFR